jgi:GTP-binding protein
MGCDPPPGGTGPANRPAMSGTGKHDFFDEATITVASGKGGDGSVHFRREKFVPLGGPDGGDGGRGGDIVLQAASNLNTLQEFRFKRRFAAQAGWHGLGSRKSGKAAPDLVIKVPTGTVIRDAESGELIGDLAHDEATLIVARGGKGGLGNSHFATSTRQAPHFAEKGEPGEERTLQLEMKLVADVGLVGLPNAGKSTLLATITAAKPKIGDYPFTTIHANLGVAVIGDFSFVCADIPGLIEGAHEGHGLGHRFLRHIERTRVLVRVVDCTNDVAHDLEETDRELRLYDPTLPSRPQVVVLTKTDLAPQASAVESTMSSLRDNGLEVYAISAVTHQGVRELLGGLRRILEQLAPGQAGASEEDDEFVFRERIDPDSFTVERKRVTFTVRGRTVERIVSMTDMESPEAVEHLQRRLKRLGVFQALEREGIRAGSRVVIGSIEMTWEGELEQGLTAKSSQQTGTGSRRRSSPGTRAY